MDLNGSYRMSFGIPFANYGGIYFPIYNNEMETEADMRYMKEMYPSEAKEIQALVEQELDKMDTEGSVIYDEYPDRVQIMRIATRIYEQSIVNENIRNSMNGSGMNNWDTGENGSRNRSLEDLIYVLLLNEIFKRRGERRNQSRRYW